jgi:ABC-type sugar transport system substrate-binding protein
MKKLSIVVSLPGVNNYLRQQETAARETAQRLGVDLRVLNAESDPVTQSQQLLEIIQSRSALPDCMIVEPVNNQGLPRVAEAAVAAGIGWVISNARVDYMDNLRKTAKAPVFTISQDHAEIGRTQGRQFAALLPRGGSILYLRGPATNFLASQRAESMESVLPPNIQLKTLKIQWTAESAYNSLHSWLRLSTNHAADTALISSQNTDFIQAARKAFHEISVEAERARWLGCPMTAVGLASHTQQLVDNGTLVAAVLTSLTMDTAIEMAVNRIQNGSQGVAHSFVRSWSYPEVDKLGKKI